MRESIEQGGRDARWEFSKVLLFGRTDHMAKVCVDLRSMVLAIGNLRQFLGPELKAVTGDVKVFCCPIFWLAQAHETAIDLPNSAFRNPFLADEKPCKRPSALLEA